VADDLVARWPRQLQDLVDDALGAPLEGGTSALLQTLEKNARQRGLIVLALGLQAAQPARELAQLHAAIALQGVRYGWAAADTLILSAGGVQAVPAGVPGEPCSPAAHFLLSLALSLDAHPAIHACALAPPCLLTPDTLARAQRSHRDPAAMLLAGRATALFGALGDGPPATPTGAGWPRATPDGCLRAILLQAGPEPRN